MKLVHRPLGLLALAGALLVGASAASADPGPAPAAREYRVLQKLHTDAVATFLDGETFALQSKADVPEGLGTRLHPDALWFHVDDASRMTTPAGMDFIAPAGSTVWIAPQSNTSGDQLWPGFSTESVPLGAIEDDKTTLRLVEVQGPGALELFTTGSFGQVNRLWSSDEASPRSFDVQRTHMHANWAFTQAGTYRITVQASVRRNGQPLTATATYTFVVGPLPEKAATTTTLTASKTELTLGERVTLTGTVAPGVDGYVEFRRGGTVLGHDRVESGTAELEVPDLAAGSHEITATFVPAVANLAAGSTSAATTIAVVDESGLPFSVTGVKASYQPGETLTARVAGATLGADEVYRWYLRYQGTGTTSTIIPSSSTADTFTRPLDAIHDDAELSVRIYNTSTRVTRSETAWVPIVVSHQGALPIVKQVGSAHSPLLPGDPIEFEVSGRPLGEGETLEWGFALYGGYDGATLFAGDWLATYANADRTRATMRSMSNPTSTRTYPGPLVVSVVKDGVRIARSEFTYLTIGRREIIPSGHRNLYREGARAEVDATAFPARENDRLTYTWTFTKGSTSTVWGAEQQSTAALTGPVLSKAEHDGGNLRLAVFNDGVLVQRSANLPIKVTDDLATQILEFSALAAHYHQGDAVRLTLTADPAPIQGETLRWEWKWPGGDWQPMPGVVDNVWTTTAEQALDGVEIRAVLTRADPAAPPVIATTRTVLVDDHGAAPRQKVSVTGDSTIDAGDTATLTAAVAPASVLDRYQWQRKAAGADAFTTIEGATGATYAFTAALADDGAQYRAALVKPDGTVGYGPSEPVTLDVRAPSTAIQQPIGGTVGPVLGLELGAAPSLGTFIPGQARTYTAITTATVTTTLRDTQLTVADTSTAATGHLVNGDSTLASPLQTAADGGAFAPLTTPVALRTFARPVSGEPVALRFEQAIGAREGIEAGSYGKTLTFTLSTSRP